MEGRFGRRGIASNSPDSNRATIAFGCWAGPRNGYCRNQLRKSIPDQVCRITTSLGVLGMPDLRGWQGLMGIWSPKEGETLVVAAATGPVRSMGWPDRQVATGCAVVASRGGADKVRPWPKTTLVLMNA